MATLMQRMIFPIGYFYITIEKIANADTVV